MTFVNMNDIKNTKRLDTRIVSENAYAKGAFPNLLNNVKRNKDVRSIVEMVRGWQSLTSNREYAFSVISNVLIEMGSDIKLKDVSYICEAVFTELIVGSDQSELKDIFGKCRLYTEHHSKFVQEIFEDISNKIKIYDKSRKILRNQEKLSKKFNIEGFYKELNDVNLISECIHEFCESFDQIYSEMPMYQRYGVCSENLYYTFDKKYIEYPKGDLLKNITEHFMATSEHIDYKHLIKVLESVSLYSEADKMKAKSLFFVKEKPAPIAKFVGEHSDILNEVDTTPKSNTKVKEAITDFLKSSDKNINKLMRVIYAKPKDDVLDEIPYLLGILRKVVFIGSGFAVPVIGPLVAAVIGITDYLIEQDINRKEADKLIRQYESELKKVDRKIEKAKDKKVKESYEEYHNKVDKELDKVKRYRDSLYSEKELEELDKSKDDVDFTMEAATILLIEQLISENNVEALTENKIADKVHVSREKFKKATDTLTGADRAASKVIDNLLETFTKSIEKALTNDKREAIIKGQILPSASKCIKTAITLGVGWAVAPAVTVIGALAALAISRECTKRERQLILDEIDIHLKIVERKIQQAEVNNDDKAIEELYKIQMKLVRERQRIKYGMKVYYNQNT